MGGLFVGSVHDVEEDTGRPPFSVGPHLLGTVLRVPGPTWTTLFESPTFPGTPLVDGLSGSLEQG